MFSRYQYVSYTLVHGDKRILGHGTFKGKRNIKRYIDEIKISNLERNQDADLVIINFIEPCKKDFIK